MDAQVYADRACLRELLRQHPDWSARTLAQHLARSLSWVKQWRRRAQAAPPDDDRALADPPMPATSPRRPAAPASSSASWPSATTPRPSSS